MKGTAGFNGHYQHYGTVLQGGIRNIRHLLAAAAAEDAGISAIKRALARLLALVSGRMMMKTGLLPFKETTLFFFPPPCAGRAANLDGEAPAGLSGRRLVKTRLLPGLPWASRPIARGEARRTRAAEPGGKWSGAGGDPGTRCGAGGFSQVSPGRKGFKRSRSARGVVGVCNPGALKKGVSPKRGVSWGWKPGGGLPLHWGRLHCL